MCWTCDYELCRCTNMFKLKGVQDQRQVKYSFHNRVLNFLYFECACVCVCEQFDPLATQRIDCKLKMFVIIKTTPEAREETVKISTTLKVFKNHQYILFWKTILNLQLLEAYILDSVFIFKSINFYLFHFRWHFKVSQFSSISWKISFDNLIEWLPVIINCWC